MATTEELLQKAAAYVKVAQPQLDAFKQQHEVFSKRASEAAKVLADNGLIARESVDLFAKQAAEDPASVWGFVEKLAESFTADSLGSGAPADVKTASSEVDPWEARLFPELHQNNGQVE